MASVSVNSLEMLWMENGVVLSPAWASSPSPVRSAIRNCPAGTRSFCTGKVNRETGGFSFLLQDRCPNHVGDTLMRSGINRTAYRCAIGVALAAAFILVWLSLGVGIIGKDGDPANVMYFGVLAVGIAGAVMAKFQPFGMSRALAATAIAQALVAGVALIAGLGRPYDGPAKILLLNGFFVALFAGSAWLFRRSARE